MIRNETRWYDKNIQFKTRQPPEVRQIFWNMMEKTYKIFRNIFDKSFLAKLTKRLIHHKNWNFGEKKLENWWKLTLGTKRKTDNGLLATLNWTMKTQTILESSSRKSELKWKKLKEKKLKYSETKKISTQKHFTTKIKTQTCKILRKNFKRHRKEKNHFKQDFALFLLYMIFFLIHP